MVRPISVRVAALLVGLCVALIPATLAGAPPQAGDPLRLAQNDVTAKAKSSRPTPAKKLTAKKSDPVPCDCTNCSAEHCQPKGGFRFFQAWPSKWNVPFE